jgi:Tfp pilus assembly protein PilN
MAQSINLIPQQEVREQQKVKIVKASTIVTVLVLVLVAAVSVFYFKKTSDLNNELTQVNENIEQLRGNIRSMEPIEVKARNLYKKYSVLDKLFNERVAFSLLLEELRAREPEGLVVASLDIRGSEAVLSGSGQNYNVISDFIRALVNPDFPSGNPDLKDLFSDVQLSTVSYDNSKATVNFSLNVTFREDKLIK